MRDLPLYPAETEEVWDVPSLPPPPLLPSFPQYNVNVNAAGEFLEDGDSIVSGRTPHKKAEAAEISVRPWY